ncbi:uncharacterized protein BDV14DRAFT_165555 [Aspergillus stella-maris]|uniref:uncharacterized protein n=1 Tax=Aspergillus stella-maris TaxID=1810926 RepID=UPI003CCDB117
MRIISQLNRIGQTTKHSRGPARPECLDTYHSLHARRLLGHSSAWTMSIAFFFAYWRLRVPPLCSSMLFHRHAFSVSIIYFAALPIF